MSTATTEYKRFSVSDRIEHWIQIVTFVSLAVTGLVQKFSGAWVSEQIMRALGGIEGVRVIHRWVSVVTMLAVAYHLGAAGHRVFVRRAPREMTPGRTDVKAALQSLSYSLDRRENPPTQGRFTWQEKYEYWALVWGTMIMILTGFMLWNPIATAKLLPGDFIPVAKAVHGNEAVLATLVIIVWHFYHVHIAHWNTSIFTGRVSRETMLREHPLELESIETGGEPDRVSGEAMKRRQRIYFPIYGVFAALMLVGIYFFATIEETAIATIEPAELPATTPTAAPTTTTMADAQTSTTVAEAETSTTAGAVDTTTEATEPTVPAAEATWASEIGPMLEATCAGCHNSGNPMGGLDVTGYEAILAGGPGGPGIVPGDPESGSVLALQEAGGHPGQLTAAEIETLRTWIEAGAAE